MGIDIAAGRVFHHIHETAGSSVKHIAGTFHIALDVADPKVRGVRSGYAPHHQFPFVGYLFSGFHAYGDNEMHYPGETLNVEIAFASWMHFSENVKVGQRIDVLEHHRLVGHVIVTEIYGHGN
ncbi:hypothetical protein [Burkholderia ubonensis]|uniref:hypothetical protein n=1 Tax=Burkholderia ubonensis TaxID=101571 RepID=UPI001054958E|nr:hypothetical protein [Burkholderia ubonensis]